MSMDDQSFQLLMSKLSGLEDGQARIEKHLDDRLQEQLETIQLHIQDDKRLADHILAIDKEVTFAKGVTYTVNAATAFVMGYLGWGK